MARFITSAIATEEVSPCVTDVRRFICSARPGISTLGGFVAREYLTSHLRLVIGSAPSKDPTCAPRGSLAFSFASRSFESKKILGRKVRN